LFDISFRLIYYLQLGQQMLARLLESKIAFVLTCGMRVACYHVIAKNCKHIVMLQLRKANKYNVIRFSHSYEAFKKKLTFKYIHYTCMQ